MTRKPIVQCAASLSISALALLVAGSGCEKRQPSAVSAVPSATPAAAASPIDWSKVRPADANSSMDTMCTICRMLDVRNKGSAAGASFTVTYADGSAQDGKGGMVKLTPELWRGMLELVASSRGEAAARAMPAGAKNYGDGHGAVRRNAYTIKRGGDSQLIFTIAKPLDDQSSG